MISMVQPDGSLFVQVMKALYGFRRSGLLWNLMLSKELLETHGFTRSVDPACTSRLWMVC